MEFNIRKLNSTDYDSVLVGWWKDWGWELPAKDFLPDDGEKAKHKAVNLLVESLTRACKAGGSKYAYALIKHKGLVETYKDLGYTEADNYTQEMIKVL